MELREIDFQIELADGKYKYRRFKQGGQDCLRNGEPWRNLTGDNLIYFMGCEIQELREKLEIISGTTPGK